SGRGCRADPDQVLPCRFCTHPSGYDDSSTGDAKPPPVKIKDRSIGDQLRDPNRLLQRVAGFGVKLGKGPVQARNRWVAEDRVKQVLAILFAVLLARLGPVAFGEQHWHSRR